jgi:ABC-type nitrate/sulfonate/bicarbonate transport system ATPase subunit
LINLVINVKDLTHTYSETNVAALDEIDLSVDAGQFVSIVGPSGCGKTTLLKILAGLVTPTSGSSEINQYSTINSPGYASYMAQNDLLLPWRRALANATLAASVTNTNRDVSRDRAQKLFARFGLAGFEHAWPSQLSGGMRQRLALLRTFLQDRDVILLDEPFGALDALTRREMHEFLQDVWLDDKPTVLLVTHDVEEALFLSDTVHVMSARPGRITESIQLNVSRPRPQNLIDSPEFIAAKNEIFAALMD